MVLLEIILVLVRNDDCADDCWLLTVPQVSWSEFVLPYDHGEPRCTHTACFISPFLLVHSGVTQPFYKTRLALNVKNEQSLVAKTNMHVVWFLC